MNTNPTKSWRFKLGRYLLKSLGFQMRIKGSHHIFYMNGIDEIINLQAKGNKAKNYQVEQVRKLILKYKTISLASLSSNIYSFNLLFFNI